MPIDDKDLTILNTLQKNGRITNAQLAQFVNLSPAATLERVRKLEQEKIIKSYHAHIDYEKLGLPVHILAKVCLVQLNKVNITAFKKVVATIPAIKTCIEVVGTGAHFFLTILVNRVTDYHTILVENFYSLNIVNSVETFFITNTTASTRKLL